MDEVPEANSIERYYSSLYRFALSLCRNEGVAADLTQETCYLWASKGHQLRDPSRLKSWLFTTLHREFLKRHRHSTRLPHFETSQVESELPSIDPKVVESMDAQTVMSALQRVEEHYRVPLAMFYLEDFSYREIAEALDVPPGTVMSRLSRGKMQLRQLLGEVAAQTENTIVPFVRPENRITG